MHPVALPDRTPKGGAKPLTITSAMRVVFLTHYAELYGANLSLLNLIDGLGHYGIQSHVLVPEPGDLVPELKQRNIPVAVFPLEWWVSPWRTVKGVARRLVRSIHLLRPVAEQITHWKCDLVYTNSSVLALGAMVAAKLRLPHVWHLREFGQRDYGLLPDCGSSLYRLGFRTADATIFVSQALRRAILGRTPLANSHVIYNGVASEAVFDQRRQAAEARRGRRQPFTFVLVGRFRASKGQAIAIRAFAQLAARYRATRFLLVGGAGQTGEQGYYEQCRSLASQLGLADRIEFWGYI